MLQCLCVLVRCYAPSYERGQNYAERFLSQVTIVTEQIVLHLVLSCCSEAL